MDFANSMSLTLVTMIRDVVPIAALLFGFQMLVLRQPIKEPGRVGLGLVFVLLGLTLFLEGLELALFPLGRLMAEQLTSPHFIFGDIAGTLISAEWHDYWWVYLFAGAIGFSTAIAEPALMAVAIKVNAVSGGTVTVLGLRIAVALGGGRRDDRCLPYRDRNAAALVHYCRLRPGDCTNRPGAQAGHSTGLRFRWRDHVYGDRPSGRCAWPGPG